MYASEEHFHVLYQSRGRANTEKWVKKTQAYPFSINKLRGI